jgi:hypothetical protein
MTTAVDHAPHSGLLFLLSPAPCGALRAAILLRQGSAVPIAKRLQDEGLGLGEAFAFLSGLYFRGKLTYARAFGRAGGTPVGPTLVITPTRGLMTPESIVTADVLREFASVDVAAGDPRYRAPLERDLAAISARLDPHTSVVLLGSVATGKYVDVLTPWLGDRLHYPASFVGRGDMSRGGLLLRSAAEGRELEYEPLRAGGRIHGARPARLERLTRQPSPPADKARSGPR